MTDHARIEYMEGRLLDEIDRLDWERQRSVDLGYDARPSTRSMIAAMAAERAAVEAEWQRPDVDDGRERIRWMAELAAERDTNEEEAA